MKAATSMLKILNLLIIEINNEHAHEKIIIQLELKWIYFLFIDTCK